MRRCVVPEASVVKRGRKPKPTHLKLVTGNPGKRALNPAEPKPASLIPDPPAELSADALDEWEKISRRLLAAGIVTAIDRAALAAYCQAYGRWVQAERALAEMAKRDLITSGLLIKTTNGHAIQNPLVGTANKAMSDMVRYAAEFGMTPSARSRVRANLHGDEKDPADQFFAS
jgi:P27 family predicted phage terminase small subunit